ncbi:hypothetical protein [Mesorhizobium sp.]|uniref:hypothetical protein n=1 Tax=Mesorhizobium sp. TaxID=1871066 RepID=UPI000FE3FBCD|nr:hypothetical protein [Mesorhizobium sp.]RWQ12368.1 MAG: hypothetical protein EOR91_01245 [Mesorhizobium sp.]
MNARFSEYVTSGAFNMTLTRSQISTLAMLASGASEWGGASLERKGLASPIASSLADDRVEWRITGAGTILMSLLFEAGLTNSGRDAAAAEVDRLNSALATANETVRDVRKKTWSMYAKLEKVEIENENLKRRLTALESELEYPGVRLKPEFADRGPVEFAPIITARDPFPDTPAADLLDAVGDDTSQTAQPERNQP